MRKLRRAMEIVKSEGVGGLLRRVAAYYDSRAGIISFLLTPYAVLKLKSISNAQEAIEFVFSNSFLAELIRPMQIREEIAELVKLVERLRPRTVLEIGTARGGTLFLWTRAAVGDATIISIDLPGGLYGGGYPFLRSILYKNLGKDEQQIILLRRDSHDRKTLGIVRDLLGNRLLDFLFIDGDHTYEGVKMDYEMYSPLVRPGGIIAFHDIVEHPRHLNVGVPRFWQELKKNLPKDKYLEIVKDWNQGWAGIGVIFKQ